ncbi:hypothetical protein TB2_027874 [Malus domestica]
MVEPVAAHDEFVDGISTKDVVADKSSGLRSLSIRGSHRSTVSRLPLRTAIPLSFGSDHWLEVSKTPRLSHADYDREFLIGDSSGGNIVHHVAAQARTADLSPLRLAGGIPIHPGFVRA